MSADIFWWWFFLCTVAGFNILAWTLTAAALERRQASLSPEAYDLRRLQLLLSAGYVLGCAYRSALPVYDVQRFVLFDTWLSSVVVGRSVATFAELCFATQWALLLREISRATGSGVGRVTSAVVVPLIALAELCSWYSVLTTSNLGHVVEESIWALSAGLLVTSLAWIWPRVRSSLRPLLAAWCAAGIGYVIFMFLVDVPMYWSRWLADEASGRKYLSLPDGLLDASHRWIVSHRWQDWHNEIAWMSLYFSAAVWLSIALVHAPVPAPAARRPGPSRALSPEAG
ncbi:MAG TPA: hypothetical protein VMT02_07095 [Burkholderiales bacterium]|jgi:hypothetical protein|nr:hypothetical protein [Burkholderiales bacterium]